VKPRNLIAGNFLHPLRYSEEFAVETATLLVYDALRHQQRMRYGAPPDEAEPGLAVPLMLPSLAPNPIQHAVNRALVSVDWLLYDVLAAGAEP
jgi:hypothetical protein